MEEKSPIYSVSEITKSIKKLVEGSLVPCWVEGEVSNVTMHSSGHIYFSLKDQQSQIKAVLWKSYRPSLKFQIEEGIKVLAYGPVRVYERGGYYHLNVFTIRPSGIGELQLAFEQLKKRLEGEGLFDKERKMQIPEDVDRIGVVTSPTGAALRDIINVIKRRSPSTRIILCPAKVQGEGAAGEIAEGLYKFNEFKDVDVIIIGRGGGSTEDLWAFNEEIVARAVAASTIPVVSAVGHEIDYTIADYVADLRAPTPSAAAEISVSDEAEKRESVRLLVARFSASFNTCFQDSFVAFKQLTDRLHRCDPEDYINQKKIRTDETAYRLIILIRHIVEKKKAVLGGMMGKLEGISPLATFKRGYSIARKLGDKKIIKTVKDVSVDDYIETVVINGRIKSRVTETTESKGAA